MGYNGTEKSPKSKRGKDAQALPYKSGRIGGAVDHVAAACAIPVITLGAVQLATPLIAAPFSGLEAGTASMILAAQWIGFGAVLLIGGLFRTRVVTIFAAEFLLLSGIAALAVTLLFDKGALPMITHGGIALVGLINSGLSRLADKAELKRDLRLFKANAAELGSNKVLGDQPAEAGNQT